MKTPSLCLFLALSLSACGDPPTIVGDEPRANPTALPPSHPPIGQAAEAGARTTFSAAGTVALKGVDMFGERTCLFVMIRAESGALWLTKLVPLAGQTLEDGSCVVPFSIDESNNMMGGPAPSGALKLHVTYNPTGYVEDPLVVAAEPVSVNDGDTGIAIELSVP